MAERARECLTSSACPERGTCDADYVRSFLGASKDIECVAASASECRASVRCKEEATCGFDAAQKLCVVESADDCHAARTCANDGECAFDKAHGCVATTDADCEASTNCKARDICRHAGGVCAEGYARCDVDTHAPAWAILGDPDDDALETISGGSDASQGGTGILVCHAAETRDFDNLEVRVGRQCPVALHVHHNHRSLWFALPNETLAVGDGVSASFVDDTFIGKDAPAFAKAWVGGASSLAGKVDDASIACKLHTAAEMRSGKANAALCDEDSAMLDRNAAPTDLANYPRSDVASCLSKVASNLGWDDPSVAKRVAPIERARAKIFDTIFGGASKRGTFGVTTDGVRLRIDGMVCGDELAARLASFHFDRSVPDGCALEVTIENDSSKELTWFRDTSFSGFEVELIRRDGDRVAVEVASLLAGSVDGAKDEDMGVAVNIDAGKNASLLVLGKRPLRVGAAGERVMLRVRGGTNRTVDLAVTDP